MIERLLEVILLIGGAVDTLSQKSPEEKLVARLDREERMQRWIKARRKERES